MSRSPKDVTVYDADIAAAVERLLEREKELSIELRVTRAKLRKARDVMAIIEEVRSHDA